MLRKTKRILNISPSTPVGLQRKVQNLEAKEDPCVITYGEDIEMTDVEAVVEGDKVAETPIEKSKVEPKNRTFIWGQTWIPEQDIVGNKIASS